MRPARLWTAIMAAALVLALAATAAAAGFAEGYAAYRRGDYQAALGEWQPLAEAGHAPAQYAVGMLHARGEGVARDAKAALGWLRRAARQDFAPAQFELGVRLAAGRGVPQDQVAAFVWIARAAENGHSRAAQHRRVLGALLSREERAEAQRRLAAVRRKD